jgi:hypothetical protein
MENILINLENELQNIRTSAVSDSLDINMSELDEISEKIILAKANLEAYAMKTDKNSFKNKLSAIPFFKKAIRSSQEIIDSTKTISQVLEEMLSYFDKKSDIIIQKVSDLEDLSLKIEKDISNLQSWILKAEEELSNLSLQSDILKLKKIITVAKMDLILKQDTLINKIEPSIQASIILSDNINTLSPIIRGSLQDELRITSSLNSFKDASSMLVELKSLIVNLKVINNAKVEDIVMSTLDSADKSLFTAEELNELISISQKSKENMISYAKKIRDSSFSGIEKIEKLESNIRKELQFTPNNKFTRKIF